MNNKNRSEEDYLVLRIKKKYFCLFIIGLCLGFLFYFLIVLPIDYSFDIHQCETGIILSKLSYPSCFANEDFWSLNFGSNIDCTCFGVDTSEVIYQFKKIEFEVK